MRFLLLAGGQCGRDESVPQWQLLEDIPHRRDQCSTSASRLPEWLACRTSRSLDHCVDEGIFTLGIQLAIIGVAASQIKLEHFVPPSHRTIGAEPITE
jgi:hypothetical protein